MRDRQCTGFSASFLHTSEGGTTRCFGAWCVKQFKHLCTDFGWSSALGDGWAGLSDVTSERPQSKPCCFTTGRVFGTVVCDCEICISHTFTSVCPSGSQPATRHLCMTQVYICTWCMMVDASLPSACPREVVQSGISAPPHKRS